MRSVNFSLEDRSPSEIFLGLESGLNLTVIIVRLVLDQFWSSFLQFGIEDILKKLKDFGLRKIFVHPDLSPEDRVAAKRTRVNFSRTHNNAVYT